MTDTLTDEQLVLALIKAYRDRGIELSHILDDPLFLKLPARSKIQAIQNHAKEIHEGTSSAFTGTDYKRIGTNAIFSGIAGAATGATLGSQLAAAFPYGMNKYSGGLTGALLLGGAGALAGTIKSMGSVDNRRALRNQLSKVSDDPSIENAIGVLSTKNMLSEGRDLRDRILDRVSQMTNEAGTAQVQPLIIELHKNQAEKHFIKHPPAQQ